jgi:hypothetical protein
VVRIWLDMYSDHGGYISTGVREVWSKETDGCSLTDLESLFYVSKHLPQNDPSIEQLVVMELM